ncbi:MAG: DUF4367 domain-containing protein [Syntrophomonadaceae bacterium]|jgi:hypothetical protein|nr:DUF4367 domain-containing protein [Syntrophomonadaceae bacterium]
MSKEQREAKFTDILNTLSEEQLKDLLRTEMMSSHTDVEFIKRINAVLNEKTARQPDCNINEKWREFASEHAQSEPLNTVDIPLNAAKTSHPVVLRKRRSLTQVAIAAAIVIALLFGGTVTAQAFGLDIWEVLAEWTSEIFKFSANSSPDNTSNSFSETSKEFHDLQTALDSYGISDKLVPKYLPVGFEQVDFMYDDNSGLMVIAIFSDGVETIIVQYSLFQGNRFQKDDSNPEIYEVSRVQHYIMTNMGSYKTVWINGKIECSISGLENKEDLIKMVDSIYER